ncbi:MAG: hypothetical protein V4550_17850 [Gemmatimonadota bacterium]
MFVGRSGRAIGQFAGGALLFAAVSAFTPTAAHAPAVPSVRVAVVRAAESTDKRIVLFVRVDGTGLVLGSYQGHLHFDPAAFVVDSAVAGKDGSRYVNPADAPKGAIRFAGFTTSGFTSSDAVRIVGRSLKPLAAAKITAELEVAGDLDGKAVAKASLVSATSVTDK